jgi:double-GTPase-like protein
MSRTQTILCPFCFQKWSTGIAAFRCTSTDAGRCKRVPDEKLGKLRGTDAPSEAPVTVCNGKLGQAFTVKKGKPVRCRQCSAPTRPVCPNCHSDLPQRFAEAPSRSMALVGTRAAGKTHFIAVVLHELEHRIGPRFNGSLMALNEQTRRRIDTDFRQRLFKDGVMLAQTASARDSAATREPLVTRLSLGDKHSNLVFFDAAGEDLNHTDILEREGRYITQSDGLILLLDPLQIEAVRDDLEGSIALPAATTDVYLMLGRLAAMLREARGIPAGKPIDVPLAIAISKVDTLRGILADNHPVFTAERHDGVFNAGVARNISESLRAEVVSWVGERLDAFLKQEFVSYSFFGVSALGENPQGTQLRNGVSPHRVEDPVLWMLDQWGALPK